MSRKTAERVRKAQEAFTDLRRPTREDPRSPRRVRQPRPDRSAGHQRRD